jgi:hypothetical protein
MAESLALGSHGVDQESSTPSRSELPDTFQDLAIGQISVNDGLVATEIITSAAASQMAPVELDDAGVLRGVTADIKMEEQPMLADGISAMDVTPDAGIQDIKLETDDIPPPPPPKTSAAVDYVDVDLGPLKSVSRNHAKIEFRAELGLFCLEIYGRNGAWVDDRYYVRGSTVPLNQG